MPSHIFTGLPVAKNIALFVKKDMEKMLIITALSFSINKKFILLNYGEPGRPCGSSTPVTFARHAFVLAQYQRGYTALLIANFLQAKSTTGIYSSIKVAKKLFETDPVFRERFETMLINND